MKRKIVIAALVLVIAGFVAAMAALLISYGPNFGNYLVRPTPEAYGQRALSFMEFGCYTDSGDWKEARNAAQEKLKNARSLQKSGQRRFTPYGSVRQAEEVPQSRRHRRGHHLPGGGSLSREIIHHTEKSAFLRCAYCHDNIKFPPEQNHLKTISGFCPGGYLFAGK